MSRRLATLVECQSVLSVEDVYDLLEIAAIDGHNRYAHEKAMAAKQAQGRR